MREARLGGSMVDLYLVVDCRLQARECRDQDKRYQEHAAAAAATAALLEPTTSVVGGKKVRKGGKREIRLRAKYNSIRPCPHLLTTVTGNHVVRVTGRGRRSLLTRDLKVLRGLGPHGIISE